jgi:hypothetical protein
MYRWTPAPYVVCYFHRAPIGEEQRRIQEAINAAAKAEKPANVAFVSVNLSEDKELSSVPPWVREVWLARKDQTSPAYLVFSPSGGLVYSGKWEVADLDAMVESPARKQLCKQLESGSAAVFVLLAGKDAQANQEAEKQLKEVVQAINSGEIELYTSPNYDMAQEEGQAKKPRKPEHDVSYLKVSRNDPQEQWLVRSLLVVEDDLKGLDEPMVFAAYGRGRVLPPYVGKGITRDNLADCVSFVTGACSCMVKEQNPGVDLPVRFDWEKAALAVAKRFGAEQGSEGLGDYFMPELVIGSGGSAEATAAGDEAPKAGGAPPKPSDAAPKAGDAGPKVEDAATAARKGALTAGGAAAAPSSGKSPKEKGPPAGKQTPKAAAHSKPSGQDDTAASAKAPAKPRAHGGQEPASVKTPSSPSGTVTVVAEKSIELGIWPVAVGVGIALLFLFSATFLVLRPR